MRYHAESDIGINRQNNEDSYFADNGIFMVADGMGGHLGGEVASRLAVETIKNSLTKGINKKNTPNLDLIVQDAVILANSRILSEGKKKKGLSGMGTTVTLCIIREDNCLIANVGDSRCYYYSKGILRQITRDHSLVDEMVRTGQITELQARHHPLKNIITNVVGYQKDIYVDTFWLDISKGDRLLLCTDGLNSAIDDEQIFYSISMEAGPEEICGDLIKKANKMGGPDNITVIVIEI